MKARLWFRVRSFGSRHANKIWLTIVVTGVVVALFGVRHEGEVRQGQICAALESGQRVDRAMIDTVLDSDEGGGIPLLDVDSFTALPPEVQDYVRDLANESAPDPRVRSLAERLAVFRETQLGPGALPTYCRAP